MGPTNEDEIEIDLREIFYAIKKKIIVILVSGLIMLGLACAVTQFFITPIYTSTSSMLVLTKETTLASLADLQMGSQLTNDYQVLILSRPVLEEVIGNLDLELDYKKLEEKITLENPTDTRILEISVTDENAETAAEIVNELADVASEFIGDKMEVVPPKIIETGEIAKEQTSPNLLKNALIGLAIGLALSIGVTVLYVVMDDTIKTEEDIEKYLQLPTLASVPDRKDYINMDKNGRKKKGLKKMKKKKG